MNSQVIREISPEGNVKNNRGKIKFKQLYITPALSYSPDIFWCFDTVAWQQEGYLAFFNNSKDFTFAEPSLTAVTPEKLVAGS